MGFFDMLKGKKEEYPPLPADSPARPRLQSDMKGLEMLSQEVTDKMELVPAEQATYVFIGKPPKQFGMAWVSGGEIGDFKKLGKEKGMTSLDLKPVMDKIKAAYENNPPPDRFSLKVGDRDLTVAPAGALAGEVEKLVQSASA
jgi:hypothetical protein